VSSTIAVRADLRETDTRTGREWYYLQLEGHLDRRVAWVGSGYARPQQNPLEFRLGGVNTRIGSVRSLRSSSISYSRNPLSRSAAKGWTQTFARAVMALGILTSCTAQTTTAFRPSNQSTTGLPTGVSEIRDRNNFRDEQQAAPQVNNAPIDP
jgi:hypothetical protein